jgi:flavin-dependent dehydrogenase
VVCDQVDLGMEAELPTPPGSDWQGRVLLDWGPVPGSYGWVFPKGDR